MPHWSATKFMLYDQCPGEFRSRYVDGVALEPSEALSFGKAMHMGLEAHYQGLDGERAFRAAWKAESSLLHNVTRNLTGMGLDLLDKVFALDLHGIPEYGFSLDTNGDLGAPIIGAIDLWDAENNRITDFKTTRGVWSQERAQAEIWQPLLYSYALWDQHSGHLPSFEYIVLNRVTGGLSRFLREWTPAEWLEQMNAAWTRMCAISVAVAQDRLECHGKHGFCPECGDRWAHDHLCDESHSRRIRL